MRIILSPAKKMRADTDSLPPGGLPRFVEQAEVLLDHLRGMSPEALKKLWKCNDQIALVNLRRLEDMDLRRNLTPAILSYDGIAFRYMAPGVFTDREYRYVQEHLRILSGFYGILRPLDGVTPYRLEMGAKLAVGGKQDLYDFWGSSLAEALEGESKVIINLASREYSLAVSRYLHPAVDWIDVVFGEKIRGKIVEKGTLCKMARGEMVRFLAEQEISDPADMRSFDRLGYRFCPEESTACRYTFLRE